MVLDKEKLINLISQYSELYDLQNEHYMNSSRKNNIWNEIAKEMGEKDTVCKEKWKCLRDSYHRNLKNRKCKSGDGATKRKKWKFESQMDFLRPYLQERATKSNIECIRTTMSDDNATSETSTLDIISTSSEPGNSLLPPSSATSLMFKNITARKKNKTQPTQTPSVVNVLQNYLDSRPVAAAPSIDRGSPIHSFFKAMADSVTALPPDLQLKIKNEVYTIVSDAEYENMTRNSRSFTEQHIQDHQVQNANNESQVIPNLNPGTHTRYVITENGILVPQIESLSNE
ncbi:hypothetical protein ABEB36_014069 [Hypothenemus hampei]|uniref:MADF domain-containing protein n=1 Tax=Hypothenemus hampei TaxID=57062 RepID=A0ABD1E368_HYPHA